MSLHITCWLPPGALRYNLRQLGFANALCHVSTIQRRPLHNDERSRLSTFWMPAREFNEEELGLKDSHLMLIRGGFIRQAHSGIYHFLPLGVRILEKLERLLDKHMVQLGASKVSLSTLSSEQLWTTSGRLKGKNPDLFHLQDRKDAKYLLSPTHEEEITKLVGDAVHSYKDLPLRLYQISRKYRDELRPRQGLLRTREFLMKDLYTFDHSEQQALQTYESVRKAYSLFFDEFKIPYLVAEADSGSIGGNLSHEYHFPSSKGEDNIINCDSCTYVTNEELVLGREVTAPSHDEKRIDRISFQIQSTEKFTQECVDVPEDLKPQVQSSFGINMERNILYQFILPLKLENGDDGLFREVRVDPHKLKHHFEDIDLGIENPIKLFTEHITGNAEGSEKHGVSKQLPSVRRIFDWRVPQSTIDKYNYSTYERMSDSLPYDARLAAIDLVRVEPGSKCPSCGQGNLHVQKAVELGHTFFLGTRYSEPLQAKVAGPGTTIAKPNSVGISVSDKKVSKIKNPPTPLTAMQMGCHGIGISRMIAAIADSLIDERGLNWPRVIAPFEAVIVPPLDFEDDAVQVLDILLHHDTKTDSHAPLQEERPRVDAVIDDRKKWFVSKLYDADLIGIPVIIVLGREWKEAKKCEVQCRRLNSLKVQVSLENLHSFVTSLLAKL